MLYYLRLLHSADKIDVVLPTAMVIFEINSETLAVVYVWTFHILSLHMAFYSSEGKRVLKGKGNKMKITLIKKNKALIHHITLTVTHFTVAGCLS